MTDFPTVTAFHAQGEGHTLTCRFDLQGGATVRHFLPPALCPVLCHLPTGEAVFVEDLTAPQAAAYRVPAHLCGPLALALDLRRVEA